VKILHAISTSRWTGAAEPVFLLCRALQQRGHQVKLAFSQRIRNRALSSRRLRLDQSDLYVTPPTVEQAPPLELKAEQMGLEVFPSLQLKVYLNLSDNWHDYRLLRRIFRDGDFDLVHCHLSHAFSLAALAHGGSRKASPLVFTHHSAKPFSADPFRGWMLRKCCDHVITHGVEVAEDYRRRFKLDDQRLSLLEGGIDLESYREIPDGGTFRRKWNLDAGCLVFAMVARMQSRRDHATLLRALARLGQHKQPFRCLLIGRGEHREALEKQAESLDISDKVVFTGYLHEDYHEALAAADVFVYTAPGSESSCRGIMEAMAVGRPVAGVRRAAVPLLIEPEKNGFLFDPGDDQALANCLKRYLDNPPLARSQGEAARLKAFRQFSIEHLAEQVEKIYASLLAENK
jgi:glycosyltransferase involved in cell wall biosynthesis